MKTTKTRGEVSTLKLAQSFFAGLGTVTRHNDYLVVHATFATVDAALEAAERFEELYGWVVAVRS